MPGKVAVVDSVFDYSTFASRMQGLPLDRTPSAFFRYP